MNLLKETIDDIEQSGHTPDDIVFIGSEQSGHSCTWDEFTNLADRDYPNGYGAQEVAKDLIIVFSDGAKMWRAEYDGSEWWSYTTPFKAPEEKKALKNIFATPDHVGWVDLAEVNAE